MKKGWDGCVRLSGLHGFGGESGCFGALYGVNWGWGRKMRGLKEWGSGVKGPPWNGGDLFDVWLV